MLQFIFLMGAILLLSWPLGRYMAAVMRGGPMRSDCLFRWIEQPAYRLMGVRPGSGMSWRGYALAFGLSNAVLLALVWALFMLQGGLPLNPDNAADMRWDLALHTVISFLTNTNQQHYAGQAQLSYLSQMVGIVTLQFLTPVMGLAMVAATLRALFGGRARMQAKLMQENGARDAAGEQARPAAAVEADVGNYWVDVVRATGRIMIPLALVGSVLLTAQGVPATLEAGPTVQTLDPSAQVGTTPAATQKIPLGPVAPMVAIKQLGSNGGGWYGPNSAVALENPTPASNFLELLAIALVPVAVIMMIGPFTGRRRFGLMVLGTMLCMSVVSAAATLWTESYAAAGQSVLAMEGKEVRLGVESSAIWASLTTQVNNGSVNMMHDSAAPLTGLTTLANMLINAIWGGVGCGLQQFLVYLLLAVFIAGLMTGRTPELFGRKIEAPEVRLLAVLVLLQPFVVLGLTALALAVPGLAGNSNPGFHGIGQVLYEYTSAFSNNGSGFEGLGDATPWWNLSASAALLLGRYPALVLPLAIAALLARKRQAPEGPGTLHIETPTFALTLIGIVVILTLLQFMPVLALGPIAEHLSLAHQPLTQPLAQL
ncbi:potassium-transporting ATPase subunit KdpA [Comamonadaceae bacterium PP-2]